MPFSSRNSDRWNPAGSFWRMVCSMTRGPANPMRAFGSAMLRSPSMAKLAVTPPVVGSVRTEMYGSRARSSRASAPQILRHLHQREGAFHHARAARAADDHDRAALLDRALDATRDLLADHDAHAAADELILHRGDDRPNPVDACPMRR